MAAAPDLVHFGFGYHGVPGVVLHSAAMGFRTFTYEVLDSGDGVDVTVSDILGPWWTNEILADIGYRLPHLADEDDPEARFSVIFHGGGLIWRSVVMTFAEFMDPRTVEQKLEEARPGSDLDDIVVEWLQVEVVERPEEGYRPEMVRPGNAAWRAREQKQKRAARERLVHDELEAADALGDFWRSFEGVELDEKYDEKGERVSPPPDSGDDDDDDDGEDHKHGSYNQQRIERARPFQTEEWYATKKKANMVWPIRNTGNNRCLEYAITLHRKQEQLRQKHYHDKEQQDGKKMSERDMVLAAGLSKESQDKASKYARSMTLRSEWGKDALKLAKTVLGEAVAVADQPRRQSHLYQYHNVLKTRLQVFTFNDGYGQRATLWYRSWEDAKAEELQADNPPLVSLLWTPPPAGESTGHFDLIPAGCDLALKWLGGSQGHRFCPTCYETYSLQSPHRCELFCRACGQFGCPNRKGRVGLPKRCTDCYRRFWGDTCFSKHKQPLPSRASRPLLQTVDEALLQVEVPVQAGPPLHPGRKPRQPNFSMCQTVMDCPRCGPNIPRRVAVVVDGKTSYVAHQCGHEICKHCKKYEHRHHLCFLQKTEWRESPGSEAYVCVDIECDTRGYHTAYLIRACVGLGSRCENKERNLGGYNAQGRLVGSTPEGNYDKDGKQVWFWFEGDGCEQKFVAWLLRKRNQDKRGFTVIAHNGSGYDYAVLYKAIYNAGDDQVRKTVHPTYRGTRLIGIKIGMGEQQIHFIDFMLHVPGSLASMVKTFNLKPELQAAGLSLEKEHFPHLLHDRTYRNTLPPVRFYPKKSNKEEQAKFQAWHDQEKLQFWPASGKPMWDFQQQAHEYNHHDVELLRRACREFRLESMAATARGDNAGCDPLQYLTTPAACMAVYRWLDLEEQSVPNLALPLNKIFRKALSGGRVEATQFYWPTHNTPVTEKLYKIDINSLYPAVSVEFRYPTGYPSEYYGQPLPDRWPAGTPLVQPLVQGDEVDGKLLESLLREDHFAFLVVDVSCPAGLQTPLLPLKEHGKNKYTLEPKYQYPCYSPMLRRAIQAGYEVTRLHGAALWPSHKFPEPALGIWTTYMKRVIRDKDEASDYPPECKSDEQKAAFLAAYQQWPLNHNNQLRSDHIENNPGRKAVAKLRANNLWGKFTARENYPETRIFRSDQIEEFWALLNDEKYEVQRIVPLEEHALEVSFKKKLRFQEEEDDDKEVRLGEETSPRPDHSMHAVIPGGLVPMYGQLKMYEFMERIGEQRCYMDTDSLIYRYDPENKEHKFIGGEAVGPYLGQFKDELKEGGKDLRITHFGSAGAKNYVLLFADGQPGKSTVKGLPRSKLHPEFQWWFIKASVIAHGIGRPELAPAAVTVDVTRFLRDGMLREGVQTIPWALQYGLVNDKVELYPDGSTLPIAHCDVDTKREYFKEDALFWETELQEALDQVTALRPQQVDWGGVEPEYKSKSSQKKKRSRVGDEKDEKDENKQQERQAQRRDRMNARLEQAGVQLRRERLQEAEMHGELDDDALHDLAMAYDEQPNPDLFDGNAIVL